MIMETGWGSHASHIHPYARSVRQPKHNRGFLARFLQIRRVIQRVEAKGLGKECGRVGWWLGMASHGGGSHRWRLLPRRARGRCAAKQRAKGGGLLALRRWRHRESHEQLSLGRGAAKFWRMKVEPF
jgi:hypothetical protein